MEIIQRKEFHVGRFYSLVFDAENSQWSFDCDEHGNVDESSLQPLALENYRKCTAGGPGRIDSWENSYTSPAIGKCGCGRHVTLANFTNTCECGADYNSSGQALAPRSQWGEETGEHWTDCY